MIVKINVLSFFLDIQDYQSYTVYNNMHSITLGGFTMKIWKQALWLANFELKASIVNILLCWFVLSFLGLIFLTSFNGYVENNYVGFDIFFLLIFSYAPYWLRSRHFQYQKISDRLYASPTWIMQRQLPIPKEILIKSRFLIYLAYLLPV